MCLGGIFLMTVGGLGFAYTGSLSAVFPLIGGAACVGVAAYYLYVELQRQRWSDFERDVNATLANLRLRHPQHASRPRRFD